MKKLLTALIIVGGLFLAMQGDSGGICAGLICFGVAAVMIFGK